MVSSQNHPTSADPPGASKPAWKYHIAFWGFVAALMLADLLTKWAVFSAWGINPGLSQDDVRKAAGDGSEIIPQLFYITPAKNTGAAWSLMSGRVSLLLFFSLAVAAVISWWQLSGRLKKEGLLMHVAMSLILGGALGNLYDRLIFGGVRDFLHFIFWFAGDWPLIRRIHDWPIFNLADVWLTVGVGVYALLVFFFHKPETPPAPPLQSQAPAGEEKEKKKQP